MKDYLEKMYPAGTRVEIHQMEGESLPYGTKGTVKHIDDIGQIHVQWDNGSNLAINTNVDSFALASE